jgi:hypothetical protein
MMMRLLMGAFVFFAAACTLPHKPEPEAGATAWPCSQQVQDAASLAYGLARFRDEQRTTMLFPAGKAMADYEAETKRLRDEGARLLADLKANNPDADKLPPPRKVALSNITRELVASEIDAADACMASAGK